MPPRKPTADDQLQAAIAAQPLPKPEMLISKPGIGRDGTHLSTPQYLEGQWVRFWQDRPRKMLGYREQVRNVTGVVRCINLFCNDGYCNVNMGSTEAFERYAIDLVNAANTTVVDRTPAGYTASDDNLWCADTIYMTSGGTSTLFAAPVPHLQDITAEASGRVYYGDATGVAALTAASDVSSGSPITTSGGLCAVGPYLFLYGHDGVVEWSVPGVPLNFTDAGSGDARPVADKIIRGLPLRGSSSPAAIFWSLSSVIIGNFVGGAAFWSFNTVSTSSSILSSSSVIEHNGIYYWATTSGFLMFSGVLQEVPNEYNQQYFLDNVNLTYRQRAFAMKVPRWKEIWWCFPKGDSSEPNHAVIFNYAKNYWYDTPLPNGGRGAGAFDVTFAHPLMSGVVENDDTDGTSIWQHEFGLDEVSGSQATTLAIKAYIRTHEFNRILSAPGQLGENTTQSFSVLEPDFDQVGPLTLEVFSRNTARGQEVEPGGDDYPYVIQADPDEENEEIEFKWQGRLTSFQITSNIAGGDFVWGAPLIHWKPGDGRRVG